MSAADSRLAVSSALCLALLCAAGCTGDAPKWFKTGKGVSTTVGSSDRVSPEIQTEAEQAVERVLKCFNLKPAEEEVTVVVFDSGWALKRFLERECPSQADSAAACFESDYRFIVAVADRWGGNDMLSSMRHELTHYVIASHFADVPPWADEGLAQYFEPPLPGETPRRECLDVLRAFARDKSKGALMRLVSLPPGTKLSRNEYAQAWGLIRFLMTTPSWGPAAMLKYLKTVTAEGDAEAQFKLAFGRSPIELEADFLDYARRRAQSG